MDPRKLDHETEKVEDAWDELVYSEALLLHDEDAKDLVGPITELIGRAEQVRLGQLNCWRAETQADASVGGRNYMLDFQTKRFERVLRRDLEDRGLENVLERPEYKAYFSISLGRVLEMALESQIRFMEPWLTYLVRESTPAVREFINIFEDQFSLGRSALKSRVDAEAATRNHRVTEIAKLFEDANTERKILAGKLTIRAAEKKLPDNWPSNFFRRAKRYTKPGPEQLRREAILAVLAAREVTPTDEGKQRIMKERDLNILEYWMSKAPLAKKPDDIFNE
jgi:hypothetical protein